MAFPFYLAMTGAEYFALDEKPAHCAWMACHFSPYGTGLSNMPPPLPENSMLILNDRTPICGHDPGHILDQLLSCLEDGCISRILLDFQRPDCEQTAELARLLAQKLPCAVGISEVYARDLECPIFLAPFPADTPLDQVFQQWKDRDIWLDAANECIRIHTDTTGSTVSTEIPVPREGIFSEEQHCHYQMSVGKNSSDFLLWRSQEDWKTLPWDSVSLAVGLYQEWK